MPVLVWSRFNLLENQSKRPKELSNLGRLLQILTPVQTVLLITPIMEPVLQLMVVCANRVKDYRKLQDKNG